MSIATRRTTPKERATSSHKPDAPDSGADVAEAQAGAQSEAAKPRSGSRDTTKSVTPTAGKYDRDAEITRFVRRGASKKMLWAQAFADSGQAGKATRNMRLVYDEVLRPAFCGQRSNGYAKGTKISGIEESKRNRKGGHAELRLNESGFGSYAGVVKCSSIWACPTCAATIRQRRSVEIQKAVKQHQASGGSVMFMTLTLRHDGSMPLAFTLDALLDGFRRVVRGNPWMKWKNRLGLVGFIKAIEITYSVGDGWHPHLHVLMFTETRVDDGMLEAFRAWLFPRWADKLQGVAETWNRDKTGKKWVIKPSEVHGIDLQRVDDHGQVVALYLSKIQDDHAANAHQWGVSGEMARADIKAGRSGDGDTHVNPFQLLDGDDCPLNLSPRERMRRWVEFCRYTKGRRCIVWTPGLKERFDIDELTDEEVIEEQSKRAVMAWQLEDKGYDQALKKNPATLAQAKHAIEDGDWQRLRELLPGRRILALDEAGLWDMALDGQLDMKLAAIDKLNECHWMRVHDVMAAG